MLNISEMDTVTLLLSAVLLMQAVLPMLLFPSQIFNTFVLCSFAEALSQGLSGYQDL